MGSVLVWIAAVVLVPLAVSILANVLTPHVVAQLRHLSARPESGSKPLGTLGTPPPKAPGAGFGKVDIAVRRQRNMKSLNLWVKRFVVFGGTFYALFAAVYGPLSFTTFPSLGEGTVLDLSSTRLWFTGSVNSGDFAIISLSIAVLLYLPCWFAGRSVAGAVSAIVHNFKEVTEFQRDLFLYVSVVFIVLLLAGHVSYLLYPSLDYVTALAIPFVVLLLAGGAASSNE